MCMHVCHYLCDSILFVIRPAGKSDYRQFDKDFEVQILFRIFSVSNNTIVVIMQCAWLCVCVHRHI